MTNKEKVRVSMEMITWSLKKCGITIFTVVDGSEDSQVNIEGIEYVTPQSEEDFHLDASSDSEEGDHDYLANNDLSSGLDSSLENTVC